MSELEHPPSGAGDPRERSVAAEFIRELVVFIGGILLGFFWHIYYAESKTAEAHIIIGLVVIIICMARYIVLFKTAKRGQG
ncbi:MAG TPA: hypothetical protein PK847_15820 [Candidatus Sumerlaeota bacterium]|nr:hypothetical protein [Candidatus Sumerlaeota bacterium]